MWRINMTTPRMHLHFMHIGKCGGSSITAWFHHNKIPIRNGLGSAEHVIPRAFASNRFYFTCVRNPYDRLASVFNQWEKNGFWRPEIKTPDDMIARLPIFWSTDVTARHPNPDFQRWLCEYVMPFAQLGDPLYQSLTLEAWYPLSYLTQINRFALVGVHPWHQPVAPKFLLPCSYWITDLSKFKIFKIEELDKMQEFFESYVDRSLTSLRKTKHQETITKGLKSYKHVFSESSLKIIQKYYHDDFINFGYEK